MYIVLIGEEGRELLGRDTVQDVMSTSSLLSCDKSHLPKAIKRPWRKFKAITFFLEDLSLGR